MKDKIKVLLISPFKGTVGGISRWTGHILDYYEMKGYNDVCLEQYYGRDEAGHIIHGEDSFVKRLLLGIKSYLPLIKDVKKKFESERIDVLHICSSGSYGLVRDWLLLKTAKRHDVKTIIHFRFGRIPTLLNQKGWESYLLNKVLNLTDRIVVLDKATLSALSSKGYQNVQLIPNPVSLKLEKAIDKNLSCEKKHRTILYVGHAIEDKGIYELIKAASTIPDTTLRIVGFAPGTTRLLANEYYGKTTSKVEFAGELPYEETIREMLSSTVFSLPSYSEGFPNVVLEAMACGCSIVATNVGAIPEMLEPDNNGNEYGMVVNHHDVDMLRVALNKMLFNKEYRSNCGENAKKRVHERYSIDKIWAQLVQLWQE